MEKGIADRTKVELNLTILLNLQYPSTLQGFRRDYERVSHQSCVSLNKAV